MKDIVKIVILICFLVMGKISLAQCDFYREINVSASGFHAGVGYTQEYVVVSNETGLITHINSTGSFSSVQPGQYLVYAVNYDGARPAVLTVGNAWFPVTTFAASSCMDIIGPYNSSAVNVCANICTDDPFTATASGFYSGGSYTETYVLVPYPTGAILGSNNTGTFTNGDYVSDGVYSVYAVNTEDAAVLSTLDPTDSWAIAETSINDNCAEMIGPYLVEVGPGLCLLSEVFLKLEGKINSNINLLQWESGYKKNLKEYQVEYMNGQNKFERIGNTKELSYNHNSLSNKSFYRIKAIFEDNTFEYSNTIELERTSSFFVSAIFPNPTKGNLNIRMESEGNQLKVEIHNTLGQIVKSENFNPMKGTNEFVIDIHSLEDAMYYVTITDGNSRHVEKITKR